MGRPYSEDLRVRLLLAVDGGLSASAASKQFRISRATAVRWAWLKRENDE
ncbi:MAG: IS630 family transposase, partial [Asticcacaulis sp.]|nr:IS630 family transposase [Asticcacaulis sp.]